MAGTVDQELKRALAERIRYYRDFGIYDFYRQASPRSRVEAELSSPAVADPWRSQQQGEVTPSRGVIPLKEKSNLSPTAGTESSIEDPAKALKFIREDLGDCTRCKLHQLGRKQIVFGVGNPRAKLMFVGEGPGADEDEQGEPFVGRAGQLLNNMIKAMGLRREDVYIANVVKCRPPGNRTPERDECETCSPFLLRQIAAIKPTVIVALGAVAARNLLALNASMSDLRGRWYDFRGMKLAVTYHPAFLLRDPRQKKEAWKDLQMVMRELGLSRPSTSTE